MSTLPLSSSSHHLLTLNRLLRSAATVTTVPFFKPLLRPSLPVGPTSQTTLFNSHPLSVSHLSRPSSTLHSLAQQLPSNYTDDILEPVDDDEDEDEEQVENRTAIRENNNAFKETVLSKSRSLPLPSLTIKEKKELGSYAHSLGKKLKSQQVGKSGVTDTVVMALIETLEANELLKLKIHNSCPGELDDVVKQLQEATGSVVVGQIGRTVILYRPSLTKLKAEEKKKEARKVFLKRQAAYKNSVQSRGRVPSLSSRGRRGSSRF